MSRAPPHSPHSHKPRAGGRDFGHRAAAGQTARHEEPRANARRGSDGAGSPALSGAARPSGLNAQASFNKCMSMFHMIRDTEVTDRDLTSAVY